MTRSRRWREALLVFVLFSASPLTGANGIDWDWRNSTYAEQTLRQAKVTNEERAAIAIAITKQIGFPTSDVETLGFESEQQMKDAILGTRIQMVDLNGDGIPEVIAQGTGKEGCSPTGNCPFWVFQKAGPQYRVLASLNAIQTFQIQRNSSGGFTNIVVEMHGSATQRTLRLLQFRGGKYHPTACYDANWSVLVGDSVRNLKEPQLTPCNAK